MAEVLLAPGPAREYDATRASGGAVRGYETAPAQRRLALDSMAELAADPILRHWSGYTRCGSMYLPADPRGLPAALTEIEAVLPGSAALLDSAELTRRGWPVSPRTRSRCSRPRRATSARGCCAGQCSPTWPPGPGSDCWHPIR